MHFIAVIGIISGPKIYFWGLADLTLSGIFYLRLEKPDFVSHVEVEYWMRPEQVKLASFSLMLV